jgi:hypothetical protein
MRETLLAVADKKLSEVENRTYIRKPRISASIDGNFFQNYILC